MKMDYKGYTCSIARSPKYKLYHDSHMSNNNPTAKPGTNAHYMPGGKRAEVDELDAQQEPGTNEDQIESEAIDAEWAKKIFALACPLYASCDKKAKKRGCRNRLTH